MRPGQIAEATGLEKAELDKAIKALKKEEKICSPKRCFYGLPESFNAFKTCSFASIGSYLPIVLFYFTTNLMKV